MSLKKLLAITLLAMSTSLSALASDVVVPVDPVIEGQEVPAKGLYFSSSFEFELSSEVEDVLWAYNVSTLISDNASNAILLI